MGGAKEAKESSGWGLSLSMSMSKLPGRRRQLGEEGQWSGLTSFVNKGRWPPGATVLKRRSTGREQAQRACSQEPGLLFVLSLLLHQRTERQPSGGGSGERGGLLCFSKFQSRDMKDTKRCHVAGLLGRQCPLRAAVF